MDGPGALDPGLLRGRVVRPDPAAVRSSHLPGAVRRCELEPLLQQVATALGVGGVGASVVEALERELARDLGVVGDQGLVGDLGDDERVLRAASRLLSRQVVELTLLGSEARVRGRAAAAGVDTVVIGRLLGGRAWRRSRGPALPSRARHGGR